MSDNDITPESLALPADARKPKRRLGWSSVRLWIPSGMFLFYGVVACAGILFFGFVIWAGRERGHSQSRSQLWDMHLAIRSYYEDSGEFPPMIPLEDFVKNESQTEMLKDTHLFTVDPGEKDDSGMYHFGKTSMNFHPWDIGSGLPVSYYTDGKGCIVFIPGRDGDFDIKDPAKLFSSETGLNNPELKNLVYDSSEGSDGDVVRVYIPPTHALDGTSP